MWMDDVRGGQITRPNSMRKISGSDRIELLTQPDRIVIGDTKKNKRTHGDTQNHPPPTPCRPPHTSHTYTPLTHTYIGHTHEAFTHYSHLTTSCSYSLFRFFSVFTLQSSQPLSLLRLYSLCNTPLYYYFKKILKNIVTFNIITNFKTFSTIQQNFLTEK